MASSYALRTSASHGNIRPSTSSGALSGTGFNAPRSPDPRRERRKSPIASSSQEKRPATASTSPSSFPCLTSSTSALQASTAKTPPSPPSGKARIEETYLAAKRRTNRQSYFEHYPERGTRTRERSKEEDLERDAEGEDGERQSALPSESVGRTTPARAHYDNGEEEDAFETSGRISIRKSLSVGAGVSTANSLSALTRKGKERIPSARDEEPAGFIREREEGVAFPSVRTSRNSRRPREEASPYSGPKPSSITTSSSRTLTAPRSNTHPYGAFRDEVPGLRFSYSTYSSSHTQGETLTPPQSPIEAHTRSELFDPIHVVVAAPISGVEAMDALVDGMDGSDDDDLFKRMQSSASKKSVHTHHPLYAPPLPPPPPGVVLGRGHTNTKRKETSSSETEDFEDEEVRDRSTRLEGGSRLNTKGRYEKGRSGSSSTILADMADQDYRRPSTASTFTEYEYEPAPASSQPPPSIDEIIRKHTVIPQHKPHVQSKTVVPSISEIIRRNTQPVVPTHSRTEVGKRSHKAVKAGRAGLVEPSLSDSDPEPITPAEEAALVARSSIDSVAAEVQQTLRAHKVHAPPMSSATNSAAASNASFSQEDASSGRYSYYSYNTTRSAGGCDQSIRSGSASASVSNGFGTPGSQTRRGMSDPELPMSLHALQQGKSNGSKHPRQSSQKDAIATYLRSARMTTLLKLTRRPHASSEQPLTVSLSDLGSPTGFPLVVFMGLGCVRYVMGLYDEMAECLGLRLITIDRWGLGRTDVPSSSASRGVPEWSTVVNEVLDRLNINQCGIMAHSAGAPYALSFASKYPERVIGDICLLAPWVGGGAGGGYRWLKYVPNGLLKTAQAAEWKIQAWMIGKPPKIIYEGIGYNVKAPVSSTTYNIDSSGHFVRAQQQQNRTSEDELEDTLEDETPDFSAHARENSTGLKEARSVSKGKGPYSTGRLTKSRPSVSSGNTFSDYDDLADFGGRFDSRTTFERRRSSVTAADATKNSTQSEQNSESWTGRVTKKKTSKGFLRIWKGIPNSATASASAPPLPPIPGEHHQPSQTQPKRKLRSLKSIGSMRNRSSTISASASAKSEEKSPVLPEQDFETSLQLGLDEFGISSPELDSGLMSTRPRLELDTKSSIPRASVYSANSVDTKSVPLPTPTGIQGHTYGPRAAGKRSISFSASTTSYSLLPSPPSLSNASHKYSGRSSTPPSSVNTAATPRKEGGESYQVAMGNALIAASHAESARGTHPDLLQILNHEQRPWGFSYARYPHMVRVWYGDRDERIAADAVKWMESAMGSDRCRVKVVKGADHGLMYRTNVVVEVLEEVYGAWMEAIGGSRRREESLSESAPTSPGGYDLVADPFKSF